MTDANRTPQNLKIIINSLIIELNLASRFCITESKQEAAYHLSIISNTLHSLLTPFEKDGETWVREETLVHWNQQPDTLELMVNCDNYIKEVIYKAQDYYGDIRLELLNITDECIDSITDLLSHLKSIR